MGKFRPYTEKDMPAVHLCAVRCKRDDIVSTITGWDKNVIVLSTNIAPFYHQLLTDYEFLDGSPCGIEEGGEE